MDAWRNVKRYLLRAVLLAGAACVPGPAAWAHAAPNVTPGSTGPAARVDLQALVRSVHAGIAEWRDDLVRELVASQLTLIGGHPMPPFSPPVPPPSNPPPPLPTTSGTPPPSTPPPPPLPPPGQNPPPPPPPPGPPSPPPTPPPPPPPVPGGGPPPVNPPPPPPPPVTGTPEPASMVTALIGAGMASLVAWRNRRRKRAEA